MSKRTGLMFNAHGKWVTFEGGKKRPYRWYDAVGDYLLGQYQWLWKQRKFRRLVKACEAKDTRYYGDGGTIHGTQHLHVETFRGTVVAVWFRCHPLPFEQVEVDGERATDMESMYGNPLEGKPAGDNGTRLHGVQVSYVDKS
jgi:hypothetical protein